ncbi:MAG TPA: GAF domain-containing sensor histidine kinase [Anaerolineaceae bacterium]|nr:GAF domain-containing sensor histidine kinase [Anaerolineaceae bacterium]
MTRTFPTADFNPEYLNAISKVVVQSSEWKPALDKIINLIRAVFIFDNLAVYLADPKNENLEVMYARAMGRGRSREEEAAWGENIANQITSKRKTLLIEPKLSDDEDRIKRPYLLAIPLLVNKRYLGAIVFIRFGGPSFSQENIELSEFIAKQIALLVERQDMEKAYELLEEQRQLARLQDDFISTISHELRSPLGFIKGYTTTLLRSDASWDQKTQQEFLQIIDQETDHLMELIENLLDSSRLQSGQLHMQFQFVRLDTLIKNVIARSCLHNPALIVNTDFDNNLMPIQGDPHRLAQVFENLLANAAKYASGSEVLITINQEGNHAHISISDKGPGIPEQYIPSLFTRFFRVPDQSPNVHGSGLGLFICKQILEAHQGEISATSILGQGTTFHILLPSQP